MLGDKLGKTNVVVSDAAESVALQESPGVAVFWVNTPKALSLLLLPSVAQKCLAAKPYSDLVSKAGQSIRAGIVEFMVRLLLVLLFLKD